MNKVTVNAALFRIYQSGLVGLDEAQARDRAHNLRATGEEGVYEVLSTIEFKRGESFSMETAGLSRMEQVALGLAEGTPQPLTAEHNRPKVRKKGKA